MSLVNNLIRLARANPAELVINDSQVGTLAAHVRSTMRVQSLDNQQIEAIIRAGELKLMDVPVRVVGAGCLAAATPNSSAPAQTR